MEQFEADHRDKLFFKIGEASDLLRVKPYILRYWETEFPMLTPEKRDNGQRVYRRSDVELLFLIQALLYDERYSIEGARNKLREYRRKGELKSRRVQAAQQRGFASIGLEKAGIATGSVDVEREGGALTEPGAGALGAGQPIPREALKIAVNQATHSGLETDGFSQTVAQLITDIQSLQASLRRAPRSTA
jgi:DNA-binding transcriptional MerR regulator